MPAQGTVQIAARHCQSKIAGLSYSTEGRELSRPELTPLGECRGARSTALEASSPRAGRDGSRRLPTALVAHNSNVQVAPVEGGGFSGIDATRAQIVQC